ncbi:kinesin family protein [Talaromyces stipitatus ATCC 10500]|uniref:Kinesin family protein n=1 Tax=Talaromyces stipitatus (strain ATCC 10500 / CBS 375.48 / QM 6759 / NRRL 1006) TaxID=441959 RepID=B8MAP7_TALSN|nr:kinesin family protein [Talaromyces stipitatus ATCC 10500]EED17471.1 kinesin family protein [Talaromyces stipitatus ATCC 10500]
MSVRVVARVRPLWKSERELDVIVRPGNVATDALKVKDSQSGKVPVKERDTLIRIPNPKNEGEQYTFQFNAVYGGETTQQELFEAEVAPTVKHLFNGFDVTIFAYGVTGTGKTHTMRGGKSLQDRGVIPRLLSAIYRRSRKTEKDSEGTSKVEVLMSYYEIYNDKVYDLFEPPEKRTLAGLPLRDNHGKTVVVGLTERPCPSLKDFESLYDQANTNRSTSATKLNAHSSRSHAILCVKLVITNGEKTRVSIASAIDLAGSEDNRRTENGKERMVESASINKSLFVLAQCVEAISKKQSRIPYRESKMTRILSLGQNNGLTLMILNLAPIRSYHLDTISSLNFANRTKKIEVREVENEPMFKGPPRSARLASTASRQPLRPLTASINVNIPVNDDKKADEKKPTKAFYVYSDKQPVKPHRTSLRRSSPLKQNSPNFKRQSYSKPAKEVDKLSATSLKGVSADKIEEMVEKKVEQLLAARALDDSNQHQAQLEQMNEQMQRRLEVLERRIEGTEDARAEGLSYLLMAKQHHGRKEFSSALRMYKLALPFFPRNQKLAVKIANLEEKLNSKPKSQPEPTVTLPGRGSMLSISRPAKMVKTNSSRDTSDDEYQESDHDFADEEDHYTNSYTGLKRKRAILETATNSSMFDNSLRGNVDDELLIQSPRTAHLLSIINSRDVGQIKLLKGVGAKKAEAIVNCLCEMDMVNESTAEQAQVRSLAELGKLKGVGLKTVQNMRSGVLG